MRAVILPEQHKISVRNEILKLFWQKVFVSDRAWVLRDRVKL